MNDKQRRARAALFSLKEVVLEVLYEARDEGYIQLDQIRKRLGIPRGAEPPHANALFLGLLCRLEKDNLVDRIRGDGWKISQEAASLLGAAQAE